MSDLQTEFRCPFEDSPSDAPALLTLEGVTRIFPGGQGVKGVDLVVRRGEVVGICGASGCGKSTLLRLVAGREHPDEGGIRRDYHRLGMVFQEPNLLPWLTALRNVELVLPRRDRVRALEALHAVGLEGAEAQYPARLSGGMRQRVGIARALAMEPDLLLMDEPFSSLDYFTRTDLLELVRTRVRALDLGVIFVSHDVREVAHLCDRVLVMGRTPGRTLAELRNPASGKQGRRPPGLVARFEERVLEAIRGGHPSAACPASSESCPSLRPPPEETLP
ncbi:ABC transporter ATP-binding protein [Ectothiorhodospira mobilis]|uniref:ABC transporter ATP-binding protein n=1 Tax=Ectothiorhodospira mobilis TaxID=195064 RepID=UPI001EE79D04|nr:ABC transporter ATP-binding protein [Ectothiorhodospira mobilis]MCG5535227.1 ABC transporter ATP-binding protein [Ectothiorhodospira mobilis]